MVKTEKIGPFSTHLKCILHNLSNMLKVMSLRRQQAYMISIVRKKQPSQTEMLIPRTNLCDIHHQFDWPPSTIENNKPTSKEVSQHEPCNSRIFKYTLHPKPCPIYSDMYSYWNELELITAPIVCHFHCPILFIFFLHVHTIFSCFGGISQPNHTNNQ